MYYPFQIIQSNWRDRTKICLYLIVFVICCSALFTWSAGKVSAERLAAPVDPTAQPANVTPTLLPLPEIAQISAGGEHICALLTTGGVKCWGNNNYGQLGSNSRIEFGETQFNSTAVSVLGLSGVAAVAAGGYHTCALLVEGTMKCWGSNVAGALGTGFIEHSAVPTDVVGLNGPVTAIAAGALHTCALLSSGGVKCWGSNSFGQLGDGAQVDLRVPVDVSGLTTGVSAIAAGDYHTCAVLTNGSVKCWGRNSAGELGDGTQTQQNIPVAVSSVISSVSSIDLGALHSCALLSIGAVQCWGDNSLGQLGNDGEKRVYLAAVDVVGLSSGVAAIRAGERHSCALLVTGNLKCWGENTFGAVGDNSYSDRRSPVDAAAGLSGFSDVATGWQITCAVLTGGVHCWGDNRLGQLGDGVQNPHTTPAPTVGLIGTISNMVAGGNHTCAVLGDGSANCWGANRAGQLGNGQQSEVSPPVSVTQVLSPIIGIATGGEHTCLLLVTGAVKCWGENQYGQVGNGNELDQLAPADVVGLGAGVRAIAAGIGHTCAVLTVGSVKCWGDNRAGQLGDGSQVSHNMPVNVVGLSTGVVAISAGAEHTCALTNIGGVKCWGSNVNGQLGDNGQNNQFAPVNVSGLTGGVAGVSAGWYHTCAVILGGVARCWGDNRSGQLGDETRVLRRKPVLVEQLGGSAKAISSGSYFTCLLLASGAVQCWGENKLGQVGDGSLEERKLPVTVSGLPENVVALTTGGYHTCALLASGSLRCWGDHQAGQLADGAGWRAEAGGVVDSARLFLPLIRKPKPPVE